MLTYRLHAAVAALALLVPPCLSGAARGEEAMRTFAADAFGKPAKTWFDPKACAHSPGDALFVTAGGSTLRVPLQAVQGASPGKIDRMTQATDGRLSLQLSRAIGCPEAPLPIANIMLSPVPLDGGTIMISWSPANHSALEAQLAQLRDSGACPAFDPGLIYCEGSRTTGTARERVAYIMASDAKLLQVSGGPLRARCLLRDTGNVCTVIDDLAGDVRYEAPVAGRPTLASLTAAHQKARTYIDGLRVKAH